MVTQNTRRRLTTAGVGVAGLLAGGVLAGTLVAQAADNGTTATPQGAGGHRDLSQPQRSDEHLLTGDTAAKVRAAALEKYPGATVLRVETDSGGVYEAHLMTADGAPVTVAVDESFAVTGEEAGGFGHGMGPGGPGGRDQGMAGDHDGDGGPSAQPQTSSYGA